MADDTHDFGKSAASAETSSADAGAAAATKEAVAATQAAAAATAKAAKAHVSEAAVHTTAAMKQAAANGQAAAATAVATGEDMAKRTHDAVGGFAQAAAERQQSMITDMTRMFKEMRFPSMIPDSGALMAAHRRNMEALSAANRMALEGAQAVARRHMEIMQTTMSELSEHVREIASTDTPQNKAAKQAELVKKSYERAVANIRELSDLIQRSNGEALGLLNERFKEAMDEVKQLLEKTGEAKH